MLLLVMLLPEGAQVINVVASDVVARGSASY